MTTKKAFFCDICSFSAPNRDALVDHWGEEERKGNDHFHCPLCVKVFRTYAGWNQHRHQFHSAEQDLSCPGCDEKFSRIGGLINHIEQNICRGINNEKMAARREEKLAFARELQRRHYGLDPDDDRDDITVITEHAGFDEKGPSNFTRYLSRNHGANSTGGASISALRPTPEATVRPNPVLFRSQQADFPQLSGKQPPTKQSTPQISPGKGSSSTATGQWAEKKQLFPNAPPPVRPTPQQLEAIWEPAKTKENAWHEWDPENPRFNPEAYYNQHSHKYQCPHPRCFKSFGSGQGLCGHLSSPAHREYLKVQCPTCLRWFDSMTALTQHSESQAVRCKVRETEEYRQFLDQLTAGIVDTTDRHEDGTNKYMVPEEAEKVFNPQQRSKQLREQAERAIEEQRKREIEYKKTYWDTHKPNW